MQSLAKKKRRPPRPVAPAESRAVETATVAWMLSVTTTLVCGSSAAIAWALARGQQGADRLLLLARYLHFSSVVTAAVSLVLLAVVLKYRQQAPPPSIVAVAAIVAVLPILAAFL
jgi:heme/copper-type cytochrome/quinol oxidase subunit 2